MRKENQTRKEEERVKKLQAINEIEKREKGSTKGVFTFADNGEVLLVRRVDCDKLPNPMQTKSNYRQGKMIIEQILEEPSEVRDSTKPNPDGKPHAPLPFRDRHQPQLRRGEGAHQAQKEGVAEELHPALCDQEAGYYDYAQRRAAKPTPDEALPACRLDVQPHRSSKRSESHRGRPRQAGPQVAARPLRHHVAH